MNNNKTNKWKKFGEVSKKSIEEYYHYLSKTLIFPITGEVSQEAFQLKERIFKVVLHNLCQPEDYFYGILAEGKSGRKAVVIALAEFSAKASNPNFQIIEDYKDWFWNNR